MKGDDWPKYPDHPPTVPDLPAPPADSLTYRDLQKKYLQLERRFLMLVEKAKIVRAWQKSYFRSRDQMDLVASKHEEEHLDRMLAHLDERQGDLFDET